MDAILCDHLPCMTLSSEKYQGDDAEEAQFFIRHWLDDVYACINGDSYSRKLLKWARIERPDFQRWCERRTIPLPEFWFPPGWALEYKWNEEALIVSASADEANPAEIVVSTAESATDHDGEAAEQGIQDAAETAPPKDLNSEPELPDRKRESQRRAIAAQVVAANLWKQYPEMTIAAMVKHEAIQTLCSCQFQAEEVVRRWIKQVAPESIRQKRGRPRKEKGTGDK